MNLQLVEYQIVHVFLFHVEGDLVDAPGVHGLDHMSRLHITEQGDLFAKLRRELLFRPANDDVRMHALRLQLLDGVLRGLGFELFGGLQIGNQGKMDAQEVLLRFHIAHRAAHFGDNDVIVPSLPQQEHPALDFVRNVRNNLDGLSQVSPLPFLGDDGVVDSARGDIIGLRGVNAQKTFIVAQVQVRLGAVLRHVAFPVLVRIQRSGVYIQIGVEFLDGDAKASCLQQFGQRGRDDSFT